MGPADEPLSAPGSYEFPVPDYEWNFGENRLHPVVYGVVLVAAGRARRWSERGSVTSTAGWGGTVGDSKPTTVNWVDLVQRSAFLPATRRRTHPAPASCWLTDTVFSLPYEPAGQPAAARQTMPTAFPVREFTASIAEMAKKRIGWCLIETRGGRPDETDRDHL